jgi:hypothetical protein
LISFARAASAMIPRIRLYASKCIPISLRTIAVFCFSRKWSNAALE